jgi:hypothetical protein
LASDGLLLGMRRGHGPPAPGQRTSGHGFMSAIGLKRTSVAAPQGDYLPSLSKNSSP